MPESPSLRSDCPFNYMTEILGDKWSLLIIRDMILAGKSTYGEFAASEEGISTNILASRLRHLEDVGLISRSLDPTNHSKYVYGPTERSVDLVPMLVDIMLWSAKYRPIPEDKKDLVAQALRDREKLITDIQEMARARVSLHPGL
ncbi:helix-turn-helix domain-containing protein [Nocardia sp. NPDC051030]|uniref:winged helix-turn-helix transcriptional regulator n=1 Tax=Nocardia sp. NPDC051030 TaxID=3155162 RepID=UPI003447BA38